MSDCADVEMRELLPELLHGRLDAASRARAEAHLATCDDCAAELALMRATRRAFAAPAIDLARIVSAVERGSSEGRDGVPPRTARAVASPRAARSPWRSWRAAAAIVVVAAGALSVIARRGRDAATLVRPPLASSAATSDRSTGADAPVGATPPASTPERTVAGTASPRESVASARPTDRSTRAVARPTIAFGGVADLSEAELEQLLADVDRLDARPAAEPERIAAPGTSQEDSR
jgi:hypothetical protein